MWAPGGDDLAAPETRERKWGASAAGHRGSAPSLRKTPDLPTPAWGPRGSGSQREAGRRAENVRVVSESVERDGKHPRTQRSAPFSSPRPPRCAPFALRFTGPRPLAFICVSFLRLSAVSCTASQGIVSAERARR